MTTVPLVAQKQFETMTSGGRSSVSTGDQKVPMRVERFETAHDALEAFRITIFVAVLLGVCFFAAAVVIVTKLVTT